MKTRLAASIGNEAACAFYQACAGHALAQVEACGVSWSLHFSDACEAEGVRCWAESLGLHCGLVAQAEGSLSARLCHAFAWGFQHADRVVVVGSDIPDVSAEGLREAADALLLHDLVAGSACDGGFYLLGLRRPEDGVTQTLFQGVPWSTSGVLSAVLDRALRQDLCVAPPTLLPTLRDIDTLEDLRLWLGCSDEQHPLRRIAAATAVAADTELPKPPEPTHQPE